MVDFVKKSSIVKGVIILIKNLFIYEVNETNLGEGMLAIHTFNTFHFCMRGGMRRFIYSGLLR